MISGHLCIASLWVGYDLIYLFVVLCHDTQKKSNNVLNSFLSSYTLPWFAASGPAQLNNTGLMHKKNDKRTFYPTFFITKKLNIRLNLNGLCPEWCKKLLFFLIKWIFTEGEWIIVIWKAQLTLSAILYSFWPSHVLSHRRENTVRFEQSATHFKLIGEVLC